MKQFNGRCKVPDRTYCTPVRRKLLFLLQSLTAQIEFQSRLGETHCDSSVLGDSSFEYQRLAVSGPFRVSLTEVFHFRIQLLDNGLVEIHIH